MYIHGAPCLPTLSSPQAPHQPADWPGATFDLQAPGLLLQAPPDVGWCSVCPAFIDFQPKSSSVPSALFFGDPADARH